MIKKQYTAGLSITEKCNLKCGHCYIGQKSVWKKKRYLPKEMTLDKILKLIPKLKQANVKRINFGGGESTLHKNFIDIVKKLYEEDMKISLTTNGTTYSIYQNYLHLFNDIGVSIDFPDERHSTFRGNSKVFHKGVKTLEELSKKGIKTELVTCLMKNNYRDLPKIHQLACDIGVDM